MAEWLGRGLQNLVQRFESASDLEERLTFVGRFFVLSAVGVLRQVLTDYGLEWLLRHCASTAATPPLSLCYAAWRR